MPRKISPDLIGERMVVSLSVMVGRREGNFSTTSLEREGREVSRGHAN